ncbi:MAG: 2-oxoacid:ferredoxin oxidoreductase subunit beta [Bacteroidales bacterium]|jgi:2-oxoglutarate ferredoxin oxidoreductase subunit beta|nr:2-oxoacid:ferredoxin oxidoreductase subunit beta [Bacteroidales bacterium]HNT40808.1 2-oxoacid:ferredoxin oxidoreductase subunit beta [Tenuifilaceae bacterium]MBP8643653.1 2-oxoacid:ferredoxin oxidoreductase subunit beta [Bacteroidales bacterium]HOA09920.1 2-oxoacid:ferredoxin oxidoreductase subunit beta [Tenuifilaceae bacterium]HOC36773.1 2-oxoacid:ferredoxin oxidoreductase subunit beta [Tenuifilaceae bacterium]
MEEQYLNYTPQDFKSDQEVRWCPGCGDHAILSAVQKALPEVSKELKYNIERYVFVSGIGCSSRFPYYVNTYGFHGIHGRASAIATGVKVANPTLSVWQITGDGDALAIGGNHFIHAIRRNIDVNILLFNNQIYGLTKGQYSPTSPLGKITKTSPFGTVEHPFRPGELVIGAQGKFFARTLDVDVKLTSEIMVEAAKHDGTSVVEILQNCVIFNDGAYDFISSKETRDDRVIVLHHGEKMVFGKNRDKGLVLSGLSLKVVTIGQGGFTMDDILVHDAYNPNPGVHMMLANMEFPEYPIALGVIRNVKDSTYDDNVRDQVLEVMKDAKIKCVDDLLNSGETWEVK